MSISEVVRKMVTMEVAVEIAKHEEAAEPEAAPPKWPRHPGI
jgi:hypothetical protein